MSDRSLVVQGLFQATQALLDTLPAAGSAASVIATQASAVLQFLTTANVTRGAPALRPLFSQAVQLPLDMGAVVGASLAPCRLAVNQEVDLWTAVLAFRAVCVTARAQFFSRSRPVEVTCPGWCTTTTTVTPPLPPPPLPLTPRPRPRPIPTNVAHNTQRFCVLHLLTVARATAHRVPAPHSPLSSRPPTHPPTR
jgi:hypothetical protein